MGNRQRQLTEAELARKRAFETTQASLEDKGFQVRPLVIGVVAANVGALVLALPIIVALGAGFFALHPEGGFALSAGGMLLVFALFFGLIAVHELIHGLTWSLYAKRGWKAVSFGVIWKYLTPYCTCDEPLPRHAYIIGALAPSVVLGLGPMLAAYATGSIFWFAVGTFMILGGGGDLTIVLKMLLFKPDGEEVVYLDHPYECGLVAFVR